MNSFYNPSGNPATDAQGLSSVIRAEFIAIAAGFDALPSFHTTGIFTTTFNQQGNYTFTLPNVPGALALTADITANIAVETARAAAAEAGLTNLIALESTRAQAEETALSEEIGNETASLNNLIALESTRAQTEETALSNEILAETTRAEAAEAALTNLIALESTRAQGEEAALDAAKQANLGFTPVQQGTGVSQAGNTIKIGFSSDATGPRITVDSTDYGLMVTTNAPQGFATAASVASEATTRANADTATLAAAEAYTGSHALALTGGAITGSLFSGANLYTGSNGNFTPCENAAVGASMYGGAINAYNTSGAAAAEFGSTGASNLVNFWCAGSVVGRITTTGTSVAYGTTSDYRLKSQVAVLTGALAVVKSVLARTFVWNNDESATVNQGFLAHEVQAAIPQAVVGAKDGMTTTNDCVVNSIGNVIASGVSAADLVAGISANLYPANATWQATVTKPQYQSLDQTAMIATMWAAIQELSAEIDALKAAA